MSAHTIAIIVHLVGLIMGFGGAVLTDVIFVKCVRSGRVGHTLLLIMRTASSLVIVGYLLLVSSGIALLATGSVVTNKFWAKMVVVVIIGINGTAAHLYIFPKLQRKIRSPSNEISIGFLHQISVVAAVSGVSWLAALVLGAWKTSQWPIMAWVTVYLLALVSAVCVALLVTPLLLRIDNPDFDEYFPILTARVNRAHMVYDPRGRARRRALKATITVTEPEPDKP